MAWCLVQSTMKENFMDEYDQVVGMIRDKNKSPVSLSASCTALLVVDMQRYFTQPSYPFIEVFNKLSPEAASGYLRRVKEVVIPSIRRLLECFRQVGGLIVFTAVGTESGDGRDLPCWLRSLDELGMATVGSRIWPPPNDPSWQIDELLAPKPGEPLLSKFSAGTFATTGLEQRLHNLGIDSVVVTGVATDVCVSTTAREAADRDFRTVIASDACTALSEQLHQASLDTFNLAFGWVRTADEVVRMVQDTKRF
jgi:nicotinamidase-related amidase